MVPVEALRWVGWQEFRDGGSVRSNFPGVIIIIIIPEHLLNVGCYISFSPYDTDWLLFL